MRERHLASPIVSAITRITPACAGKTRAYQPQIRANQDHPRMCGKDQDTSIAMHRAVGSPPHVRERLFPYFCECVKVRITPACAGKTRRASSRMCNREDHPRMCGKDSNGSLYFRPFTPADIQNLFNFFAKHLTSSASPNAR